jgi:aspartate/methionine/tyrosine aminotransferase
MYWAKLRAGAKFNLANSGVMDVSLGELPVRLEDLELTGPSWYGYEPLQQAIARHCGVSPDCVFAANGTSLANHLAMAAVLRPGDEVLIEHPTYELLLSTARYLCARVTRFARRFEHQFSLDPAEVARAITSHTRLVVLTNLHNPSGVLAAEAALQAVGEVARRVRARVLVDEVYLEAAFDQSPRSAFHLGEEFICTNSLTKVYGLSGLRCGWVLARPDLTGRLWRLNDLFGVIAAHPAERLSVVAFRHLGQLRERAGRLLENNWKLLRDFLGSRADLEWVDPGFGTVVFPRVLYGRAEDLCRRLREKYQTTVVPGRFFEMPEHIRIGIGNATATVAGGLERLGAAVDETRRQVGIDT